jgi:hypothetical protein
MKDDPNNSPGERDEFYNDKLKKDLDKIRTDIEMAEKKDRTARLARWIEDEIGATFRFLGYTLCLYSFMYLTGIVFSLAWNNLMAGIFHLPILSFTNGFCVMLMVWLISRWFVYPGKYKIGGKE